MCITGGHEAEQFARRWGGLGGLLITLFVETWSFASLGGAGVQVVKLQRFGDLSVVLGQIAPGESVHLGRGHLSAPVRAISSGQWSAVGSRGTGGVLWVPRDCKWAKRLVGRAVSGQMRR